MVLPEDNDNIVMNQLNEVLDRIADSMEKNSEILNRIADHYDSVVPVMARNQKRVEQADVNTSNESALDKMYGTIFGTPKEE